MPAPPPLAILTHEFFPYRGGIAIYVEETARAALDSGHAVTVWAPTNLALRKKSWPFRINSVAMRGKLGWFCRLALARAIRAAAPQLAKSVVWLPEPGAILTAMYLNVLGLLPAKHLVLTLHGSEILRFAQRPHRRFLFQKLLDRAGRVGVVSEYVGTLLREKFTVPTGKTVLVSGALRSDFFEQSTPRPPRVEGAPLVLLTVGRIHPRKGQHCLLEALALLPPAVRSRIAYNVAGPLVNLPYRELLENLSKVTRVPVRFIGEVSDDALPDLYDNADIFALTPVPHGPSLEGFGLVYLEAAAHGLPSLAHRIGGVPEAVRDGVTGLLADPWDRPALAANLERLLAEPELRARLGANAKVRARELSWSANVHALFAGLA